MNKAQLAEYRAYYDTFGNLPPAIALALFEAAARAVVGYAPVEDTKPVKKSVKDAKTVA